MNVINTRLVTDTTLTAGAFIPVGNIVHKSGSNLSASGTTWRIQGGGYYDIRANITVEPTAVADMVVTLYNNGAPIATATATPAVASDPVNVTLLGVVYSRCGCSDNNLTISVNSAGVVTEADVIIERL